MWSAPAFAAPRRVAVTGLGAISALGVGMRPCWERLLAGGSGVRSLAEEEGYGELPPMLAALVPRGAEGFEPQRDVGAHMARVHNTALQYAAVAAREAVEDAGLARGEEGTVHPRRGVAIGCGIAGAADLIAADRVLREAGPRRISPYLVPNALANMAAGLVASEYGCGGPQLAPATACAASATALGEAFRAVSLGDADVMLAGGTEACVLPVVLAGFHRLKALATGHVDSPGSAMRSADACGAGLPLGAHWRGCRPFDRARSGFVAGEGAAVLVLEELGRARRRGARVYAEIRGCVPRPLTAPAPPIVTRPPPCRYGASADAGHITAPAEGGEGALRAMRAAMSQVPPSPCCRRRRRIRPARQAGRLPDHLDYVNAHGTSTPLGDRAELAAIDALLDCGGSAFVSSTKAATGHLLGAAGAVEAAFTVMALASGAAHLRPPPRGSRAVSTQAENVVPPTLNLVDPDPHPRRARLVGPEGARATLRTALSNSFGFGGVNVSLCFAKE